MNHIIKKTIYRKPNIDLFSNIVTLTFLILSFSHILNLIIENALWLLWVNNFNVDYFEIVILCRDATGKKNKRIKICRNLGLHTARLLCVLSTPQKSINAQFISCLM